MQDLQRNDLRNSYSNDHNINKSLHKKRYSKVYILLLHYNGISCTSKVYSYLDILKKLCIY